MRSFSANSLLAAVCFLAAIAAVADDYAPFPSPGAGYVTDLAGALSPEQEERIEQTLRKVEQKSTTEIMVVTIDSIHDYAGASNSSIESFAKGLFNRWGIGNRASNDGILFLVAVKDRQARIELGAGYSPSRDHDAARIMQEVVVPRFMEGDYSTGITRGVEAIIHQFTGVRVALPWKAIRVGGVLLLLLMASVSLALKGKRGWGWVFFGLVVLLAMGLLYFLVTLSRSRRRSHSSGWRSGGSGGFGGGFSRGGGATGSW